VRLLTLSGVGFTYRKPALLEGIDLAIDSGERIGLLGRNGVGKSTLMRILAGDVVPDHGVVKRDSALQVSRLVQDVPSMPEATVRSVVAEGWKLKVKVPTSTGLENDWRGTAAIHKTLSKLQLDPDREFDALSAGMKRRVLLAQALVIEPDLLLLDEPTNHLDLEAILWLEGFLKGFAGSLVFITHDRVFLQSLATRILEIDRGRLLDWECDYQTFLQRKGAVLEAEEKQEALFDKRLAEEERWIRQGIKARRTRNEGRVRALEEMRRQRTERRQKTGEVSLRAVPSDRSGQMVMEVRDLTFRYADRTDSDRQPTEVRTSYIIRNFSTLITRGEKIGIVGPNGSGKSTLLKLLLGELTPSSGSVRHGARLDVLYFDQLRQQINEEQTVAENVGEGQEKLLINGQSRHIFSYLNDFLFSAERAREPAKFLSGGERHRLLLAKLFRQPSNVLVLDEPTNDLDAETLEMLEELVVNYSGTLLLVSHDRAFLNNVVTSILALNGEGEVKEYGGGYDDYARQRVSATTSIPLKAQNDLPTKPTSPTSMGTSTKRHKLSYKDQRELEELPSRIEALEAELAQLHVDMSDVDYFKQTPTKIVASNQRLADLQSQIEGLYGRWEKLDSDCK
jgi:ATP-binding cassette subfamily F protein uup